MIDGNYVPGKGLPGAVVSIKDRTSVGVMNNDGSFSFPAVGKQLTVQSVTKNPLYLVMETPEQLIQDQLTSERRIRRTLCQVICIK